MRVFLPACGDRADPTVPSAAFLAPGQAMLGNWSAGRGTKHHIVFASVNLM